LTELAERLQAALGQAYTIERELGGGGMSRVFIATETGLGRRVVIKVLPPELAAGLSIDRFRREIQLAASLQHPHIVPLLAASAAEGVLYYTMPLIEGESLRTRIARVGELPIGEAIRILRDVVDALACAHERGIIHRDIKPDNVLVSRHHGLVTDFGVAKALSEASGPSSVTSTGIALGTPAYMAPEQAVADPHVDHRADVYAVGALGYEMLTGRPPFTGSSPQAVLAAQVTQAPEPVSKIRSTVPPALTALIMRCLEKHPADRWQTTDELLHQLEAMATPSGGTAPTAAILASSMRPAPGHPLRVLAVFVAVSAVVLVATRALMLYLGLPDWVFPAAVVLLAIGLPIILTTALVGWRGSSHHLFTWRKAISGGFLAFAGLGVLTAGYMLMRALGIGPVGSLVAAGTLKERERIIVADFENRTGDRLLGEALSQAFRVDFAQSPVVTSVQPEFVRDVLSRMGKPDSIRLELPLAREVAIREGIKAVVAGDINPAGRQFVLSARLIGAENGDVLAAYRETAKDSGQVIPAVDRLSKRLRERIGESLRSIRGSPPLERVTTRSLEALRKYSQGVQVADDGDTDRGVALLEEAIALDSGFAMAHRKIGILLGNTRQRRDREVQALSKAFEYRNRLTDRERYLAAGSYFSSVTGEHDKAIEAYRSLLDLDPQEPFALNNLALEYEWNRDYSSAVELLSRAIAVGSDDLLSYGNLSVALVSQGLTDSASAVLKIADQKFATNSLRDLIIANLLSALGSYDSATGRLLHFALGRGVDAGWRSLAQWQLANIAAVQGRFDETDHRFREAMIIDEQRGSTSGYLRSAGLRSFYAAWFRNEPDAGPRIIEAALRRHPLQAMSMLERPYLDVARAYAAAGKPTKARSLLEEYEREVPPILRRNEEPDRHLTRGLIALAENRTGEAITEFRAADQGDCPICALAGLGRAYDLSDQSDSAVAVYERYVSTPWMFRVNFDGRWLPEIYNRLGLLYENRGERKKSAEYYGRFIDLWKNADPTVQPRVAEAKRRLASVTGEPQK
jgi:eukaryotic-like serine/threonine-protein kinase